MISVSEAMDLVLGGVGPLGSEDVALMDAQDRILTQDVTARLFNPPCDVSAMDGYAVRHADLGTIPVTLTRIGESAAGAGFDGTLSAGQCTRIFTGAPVPAGADTIIIQENTTVDGDQITINEGAKSGYFIRPKGLDFSEGDVLLKSGTQLGPRELALAAAMNIPTLTVRRRPRIGVLATGDELVDPGQPVGPGQIVSSNSVQIEAFVRAWGGEPVNPGIARDTEDSLREKLSAFGDCDMLVTIGGASVGDYDLVGKVLGEEGMDLGFYKVAMRPGKPLIFGRLQDMAVLGLPGNPVSAGVTATIFLKAAMTVMQGLDVASTVRTAILGRDLAGNDQRQDYLRSTVVQSDDGSLIATPFDKQDSAMLATFARADGLVIRAPHAPAAKAGDTVETLPLTSY